MVKTEAFPTIRMKIDRLLKITNEYNIPVEEDFRKDTFEKVPKNYVALSINKWYNNSVIGIWVDSRVAKGGRL